MTYDPYKILFLCTGNSARSVLGEYLLRDRAPDRFETHSAGSDPQGEVHPLTLEVLRTVYGIDASKAHSKSWRELADVDFDIVITVCDHARETCPLWPGSPIVAHWGMADPAAVEGSRKEQLQAFKDIAFELQRRLDRLCDLPIGELSRQSLQREMERIGEH